MIDFVDKNDLMALTGYSQTQCKEVDSNYRSPTSCQWFLLV